MNKKQLYRERVEFLCLILVLSVVSVALWGFRFEAFLGVMAGAITYNLIRVWQS